MKRHHIVGIIAEICGIGFTVRSALSGNIIDALIDFTLFSVVAVSTFFKDKLPPRWSQLDITILDTRCFSLHFIACVGFLP